MTALVAAVVVVSTMFLGLAQDAPARTRVTVAVTDASGAPVAEMLVFAADAASDEIVSVVATDAGGRAAFELDGRPHNFGLYSTNRPILKHARAGEANLAIQVGAPLRESARPGPGVRLNLPRARVLRGRVVDEGGAPLAGVRVQVIRPSGTVATTAISDRAGRVVAPVVQGRAFVTAFAPGLKLKQGTNAGAELRLVMTIDSEPQTITVSDRHVIRFHLRDSVDPEYVPPAPVKAWLCWAYGIGLPDRPLTGEDRKTIKKYWWLDKLREEPPNPARVALFAGGSGRPEDAVNCPMKPWQAATVLSPPVPQYGGSSRPGSTGRP
jgi:hypothetical protein